MSVATRTGNLFFRTEMANGKVDIKKACIPKKTKAGATTREYF